MDRRSFLVRTGLALSAGSLGNPIRSVEAVAAENDDLSDWKAVRNQFNFTPELINMACLLLASHPKPVRQAIEKHRKGFDLDPISYLEHTEEEGEASTLRAAADYMGVSPTDIALTISTTMGLGVLYGGLSIRPDQDILATTHDHYVTDQSLRYKSQESGAYYRQVTLYDNAAEANAADMVERLAKAIRPKTRIIAVTYVHSCTGVKLPIRQMADAVAQANVGRSDNDRAIFCVDGVHGFGSENITMDELGCDFFVAGTHKWLFGPRGTGLVWGKPEVWQFTNPTITAFNWEAGLGWIAGNDTSYMRNAGTLSPGGFQPYEHRWSVGEAFKFHLRIGKDRVHNRIHSFARHMKEELARMPHVTLYTPMSDELSSGIVCFDVDGMKQKDVVAALREKKILASTTPYRQSYARLTPGLLNSEDEVETTLRAVRGLKA